MAVLLAALAAGVGTQLGDAPADGRMRSAAAGFPASPGLHAGLTQGGADAEVSAAAASRLGARQVRVEFAIGSAPRDIRRTVELYAARGIRVLPLAGFDKRLPSPQEARNVGSWARAFGPGGTFWARRKDGHLAWRAIEFGNETSYAHQRTQLGSGVYAERLRDAHRAIHGASGNARVGLLAQADDGGSKSSSWVDGMFDAVPELATLVAGWTVHPYGPEGVEKIGRVLTQTAARGAPDTIPVEITEWGLATDGGRCLSDNYGWDPCMESSEAAAALRTMVTDVVTRFGPRVRSMFLYQATDQRPPGVTSDRERFFGALRGDLSSKGAYTTEVRRFIASFAASAGR